MSVSENQLRIALDKGDTSSIIGKVQPTDPEEFQFVSVPGSNQVVPAKSAKVVNITKQNLTGITSTFTSAIQTFFQTNQSNYIDFILDNSYLGSLQRVDFLLNFTVSTANVTLLPTFFWWNRIEILCNPPAVAETYSTSIEYAVDSLLSITDPNQVDIFCANHGTDSTLAAQVYVPGTYNRLFSLNSSFLSAAKLVTASLKSKITIRLYPENWANLSTAGLVANIQMNTMTMNVSYDNLPPYLGHEIVQRINSREIVTPFISPVNYLLYQATVNFVRGTQVSLPLSTIVE